MSDLGFEFGYRLTDPPHRGWPLLGQHIYLGFAFETGQAWDFDEEPALGDLLVGGTAFLGVETLLGPFYAGFGLVEGGQESFYIMLGRTF